MVDNEEGKRKRAHPERPESQTASGIPETLSLSRASAWVEPRVSPRRFQHISGVAQVSAWLSHRTGGDAFQAELAAWLHDACKEIKDKELVRMARDFGLDVHPLEEANGHLLHGPVAAETIKKELGVTNLAVLDAIRQHTLGAVNMTRLSQVLFLADCLEPSRSKAFTAPIWQALGTHMSDQEKKSKHTEPETLDLEAAMLKACDLSLQYLLEDGKVIHPRTVDVRNYFLNLIKKRS